MTTYVTRSHPASTTIDSLPRATGEYPVTTTSRPGGWTYHTFGNVSGWIAALLALGAAMLVPVTGAMIRFEAYATAAVLVGVCLICLAASVVGAVVKTSVAMASRAAAESERRIISQLGQQLEQQIGALYRAVPRECREAVRRQGEQLSAELLPRVVWLERQVGEAATAEAVIRRATGGGQVVQLHPTVPRQVN